MLVSVSMHAEKIGKGTPPEEFTLYALLRAKGNTLRYSSSSKATTSIAIESKSGHLFIKRRRREGRKYYEEEEEVSRARHATWIHR